MPRRHRPYSGWNYNPFDPNGAANIISRVIDTVNPPTGLTEEDATEYNTQRRPPPRGPAPTRPISLPNMPTDRNVRPRIHRSINGHNATGSLPNMPQHTDIRNNPRRPPGTSRGTTAGDEEVPVIPAPAIRSLTAPDYFTVDLPYTVTGHITTAKQNIPLAHFFKMNSIFDPQTTSSIGTEHQPMGRDLWAGVYNYYRVLESHCTVTVVSFQENEAVSGTTHPAFIFAISPQETVTPTLQTREALMESKISKWQIVYPMETNHHSASMSFSYRPEDWVFHVSETGIDERWTPNGANPAVIHYLCLHVGNMFDGDVRALNFQLTVSMKFTVQFREANSTYIHTIDTQA